MSYKQFDFGVLTNDANGICQDQTTSGAGSLTLNGALVSGGVATAAHAQIVAIEGTGDNSGIDFTVTGTDANGVDISQTIDGANNGTAKTTIHFKTVDGVSADGAVTGNVEVGFLAADGAVSNAIPVNHKKSDFEMSFTFDLTAGSMTLSAQYTLDDPEGTYSNSFSADADWRNMDGLTAKTADAVSNLDKPVRAIRWIQTVGSTTGTATCTSIQGTVY